MTSKAPKEIWAFLVKDSDDPGHMFGSCWTRERPHYSRYTLTTHAHALVADEVRENIVDEIEEIIGETHDLYVTDRNYAENIVGWLERHHPAALSALAGQGESDANKRTDR